MSYNVFQPFDSLINPRFEVSQKFTD